jgi:endonuclease/exonuclease/phosphatase (EEP) superfamily protein YafD
MPRALRFAALLAVVPLLASCISITVDPRGLTPRRDGTVEARTLPCPPAGGTHGAPVGDAAGALDPRAIRLVAWNLHKQADAGWERDLSRLAEGYDLLLLQEVTLGDPLRGIIADHDLSWVMASSFLYLDDDVGVLTAARVAPVATCTQRAVEPLIRLPKSAVVAWFPVRGERESLAVVNVHAINFSLSLDAYAAQFRALGDALAGHAGPIVVAGDFNTWTDGRSGVVRDFAAGLGLVELTFAIDLRSRFFGRQFDHILVRGLEAVDAIAIPVTSSDHNPVAATLRVTGR